MATLRDIKGRISGIKSTQQITKAMKMVAAARLRRAQENALNARPYSKKITELLNNLLSIEKNIENDLIKEREFKNIAVIVVTSDRGLCGGFNMNIIRTVEDLLKGEYSDIVSGDNLELYCIGKKGADYFSKRFNKVPGNYSGIFSHLKFDFAAKLIADLKFKFLNHEIDKIVVVYNEFKSVVTQNVRIEQLLPIKPEITTEDNKLDNVEYIYEPDKSAIINSLLPKYLNTQMWKILLESYTAELGARMTAMDMATENAKELIRSLQLTYNKIRQASITTEIIEIVSGANSLKES